MSEEKQNITAKNWNKLYRLDEHNEEDINYSYFTGEYNIKYFPERFTTKEHLNYSIGVWKESENKMWMLGGVGGVTPHSDIMKMIESDRPLRTLTKMFGYKEGHYDLVERKIKSSYTYDEDSIPTLRNIGYAKLAYTLRFFRMRAGLEPNDNFDGMKLVLLSDCINRGDSESPAEIDRACQAAVKIMHVFGDASQYLTVNDDNKINISLTRTGKVVTKTNMKDNYKEIGRHNGEEQMREKENIIKEGVI
tara:strand:- start:6680 stop:7426 length:747 start_codon:yes stop_codon:yes gene_type:complete